MKTLPKHNPAPASIEQQPDWFLDIPPAFLSIFQNLHVVAEHFIFVDSVKCIKAFLISVWLCLSTASRILNIKHIVLVDFSNALDPLKLVFILRFAVYSCTYSAEIFCRKWNCDYLVYSNGSKSGWVKTRFTLAERHKWCFGCQSESWFSFRTWDWEWFQSDWPYVALNTFWNAFLEAIGKNMFAVLFVHEVAKNTMAILKLEVVFMYVGSTIVILRRFLIAWSPESFDTKILSVLFLCTSQMLFLVKKDRSTNSSFSRIFGSFSVRQN